jgi:electron transport complex protein RnfD
VTIALLPCCVAAGFFFGILALILLLLGMILFTLSDYLFSKYVRKETNPFDLSSLVSGAVLALLLPPTVSVWTLAAGVLFASIIIKQCFGGVGTNLFNPAMAGRAFLFIAFPFQTSVYIQPMTERWSVNTVLSGPIHIASEVSPMVGEKTVGVLEILSGSFSGAMGTTGVLFALLGGVYLLYKGILKIHAPIACIVTILVGYWLFFAGSASVKGLAILIFTGGVVFCAVFSLGDYSTIPTSRTGRIIFGTGTGLLMLLLTAFGEPAYCIVFSVLLMNVVTPILEFYIRPRIFAEKDWFSVDANVPKLAVSKKEAEQ